MLEAGLKFPLLPPALALRKKVPKKVILYPYILLLRKSLLSPNYSFKLTAFGVWQASRIEYDNRKVH